MIEAGPLVQLQISLSRVPWRLAPAWSVLAGAFAADAAFDNPALWLRVVAAVVLGDLAWGVLRRYVQHPPASRQHAGTPVVVLPYAQPDAPLGSFVHALSLDGTDWRGALAGVIFALGGALLLGLPALALSLAAVVVTVVAWALTRRGDVPAACFALLDVFLPFVLGLLAAGWLETGASVASLSWQPLLVAAAFAVLQWGALRSTARVGASSFACGVLVVLVVLIGLRMPWAAAMAAVLLAPPLYWLSRNYGVAAGVWGTPAPGTQAHSAASSTWAAPWLMLALFIAALAVR